MGYRKRVALIGIVNLMFVAAGIGIVAALNNENEMDSPWWWLDKAEQEAHEIDQSDPRRVMHAAMENLRRRLDGNRTSVLSRVFDSGRRLLVRTGIVSRRTQCLPALRQLDRVIVTYQSTTTSTFKAQARAKGIAAAKATADGNPDARDWLYGAIAEVQAEAGDIDGAMDTINCIAEGFHKSFAYQKISFILAKAGKLPELFDWAENLPTPYERTWAYIGAAEGIIEKNNEAKNSKAKAKEQTTR